MSRQFDMCDVCKLDKVKVCNYECIKRREDRFLRFFACPHFIHDDGKPIINAEYISTLLKTDIELSAMELWFQTVQNDGCVDVSDFKEWLKNNADLSNLERKG